MLLSFSCGLLWNLIELLFQQLVLLKLNRSVKFNIPTYLVGTKIKFNKNKSKNNKIKLKILKINSNPNFYSWVHLYLKYHYRNWTLLLFKTFYLESYIPDWGPGQSSNMSIIQFSTKYNPVHWLDLKENSPHLFLSYPIACLRPESDLKQAWGGW